MKVNGFYLRKRGLVMAIAKFEDGRWQPHKIVSRLTPIPMDAAAVSLNYGLGVFEGMKAYRTLDGRIVLFRPWDNARRLIAGAQYQGMRAPTEEMFLQMVEEVVRANASYIPAYGEGAMYIRPLLIATGERLGIGFPFETRANIPEGADIDCPAYTFVVFMSPVGNYFPQGFNGVNLLLGNKIKRTANGMGGSHKLSANYGLGVRRSYIAKTQYGCAEVLYTDGPDGSVSECGAMNVFFVRRSDGVILTHGLTSGTVLPGITRDSVMQVARELRISVLEMDVHLEPNERRFTECFGTGTAAVVAPVLLLITDQHEEAARFTTGPRDAEPNVGDVTRAIYDKLTVYQTGIESDPYGWRHVVQV